MSVAQEGRVFHEGSFTGRILRSTYYTTGGGSVNKRVLLGMAALSVMVVALGAAAFVLGPTLIAAPAEELLAGAIDQAETLEDAAFDINMRITAEGRPLYLTGRGAMRLDDLSVMLTGTIDDGGEPLAFEQRTVDGIAYVKIADEPWYATPVGLAAGDPATGAFDPAASLQYLKAAATVRSAGTERVRDVDCRHLEIEIDEETLAGLLQESPAGGTTGQSGMLKQIAASEMTIDAWIGIDDGMLYRETVTMKSADAGAFDMVATLDLTAFNPGVEIAAPEGAIPLPEAD